MELYYFKGLQDSVKTSADKSLLAFKNAILNLARNKTRHMLIADYVKTLQGSVVVICPTNIMCQSISELLPNSVCVNGAMSIEDRDAAICHYANHGILITNPTAFHYIDSLKAVHNVVFTTYTYFSYPFINKLVKTNVQKFHQIVDNVKMRGVLKEAFLRLDKIVPLNRVSNYDEFTKF